MPTDEQFNARGLMRPRLRPRLDAPYMDGSGLVAPQVTAQVPSIAPRPMSSAGYGSQNAPGREESFSTAPTDTAPTPDELKQLQQNRWRRVLQQETAIRQARMAGAQSGRMDYGTIHEMENELKLARASHNELNSILSRRTTDQNEGEFNASQESLRNTAEMNRMKQYPADFIGPTMEGHRAFFLGDLKPYNDPSNVAARAGRVAQKDTVLNSPDTQRELADLRRNMMRNQLAKRVQDANDQTELAQAEAGPTLVGLGTKRAIAQASGEADDAGIEQKINRASMQTKLKNTMRDQAFQTAGFDPTTWSQTAQAYNTKLSQIDNMDPASAEEFVNQYLDDVIAPLDRIAEIDPKEAAKFATSIRGVPSAPRAGLLETVIPRAVGFAGGNVAGTGLTIANLLGRTGSSQKFGRIKKELDRLASLGKE